MKGLVISMEPIMSKPKYVARKIDDLKDMLEQTTALHSDKEAFIKKAKDVEIVGLKVNLLLGNYDTADETDIGPTEEKTSHDYKTITANFQITTYNKGEFL